VARRPKNKCQPSDFIPCSHCFGFFKKVDMWRHIKNCKFREQESVGTKENGVVANCIFMLEGAIENEGLVDGSSKELKKHLTSMRNDTVTQAVKSDPLILKLGEVLIHKLGSRRKNVVTQKMRQLGRLKLELEDNETTGLQSFLTGKKFDHIVVAVEQMAGFYENNEGVKCFTTPSLALTLGYILTKAAQLKRGLAFREDDELALKETANFLELMKNEWADKVSSLALSSLRMKQFNKPDLLPVTEDLIRVKNFIDEQI